MRRLGYLQHDDQAIPSSQCQNKPYEPAERILNILLEEAGFFALQRRPECDHFCNLSSFVEDQHRHTGQYIVLAALFDSFIGP